MKPYWQDPTWKKYNRCIVALTVLYLPVCVTLLVTLHPVWGAVVATLSFATMVALIDAALRREEEVGR